MTQTVLMTGSSRGIGAGIAWRLANDGYDLLLHCRGNLAQAEALRQRIGALGRTARVLQFDISDREQARSVLEAEVEANGAPYGVVCNASTESIDPGRRPLARGREESEEGNIYRQHPQLSRLLRTTFDTLVIGHGQGDALHHYLPPRPPRVHSFVYLCEGDEVRRFTQSLDFLAILLGARAGSVDEVVSACLRRAAVAHDDERAFLVRVGKELAVLLGGELNRLNAILRRIRL